MPRARSAVRPPAPTGPLPGPSGVVDGETAAPALGRQDDGGTTTTGEDPTTTAPPDPTTTTPVGSVPEPVPTEGTGSPEAGVDETVVFPTQEAEGEPRSCVQLGPAGFTGDALSRSRAELGGETGSQWVVSVAIKQSRRADANALMNSCQSAAPTCSTGQMAIVLDEEVVSAPTVNDPNLADDDFLISGGGDSGFSEAEAKDLALVLRYGALPVEFTRSAERQVSPSLGSDSLRAGLLAGALGLAAVALYLIVYYRALGILVVAGLAVWSILMYGLVCWLSATRGLTLSLSGVVGIVVSVGTTVDSYVLHFERLKDEVRLGKSVRASTERGFQMAFRTILTANIAALMGAVLLWYLTVGAVRGFAFFLGLSVLLDLFVIYTFERPTVALLARSRFFTEHPRFGVARGLGRSGRTATAPAGAKP